MFFPSPQGKLGTPLILSIKLTIIKKCYVPILTAPLWTNAITSAWGEKKNQLIENQEWQAGHGEQSS